MKSILIFIITLCSGFATTGQTKLQKTDSVSRLVHQYFNERTPDKMYELTGEGFQKMITRETFRRLGENQLLPLGSMELPVFEQITGDVVKYKVKFTEATLSLVISLDEKDKINTFLFQPYIEETKKKVEAPTSNPRKSPLDIQVDAAVRSYIERLAATGLSIGILRNGEQYFYNYGELRKGSSQLPTENSLYEIGSITKTFTAILLTEAVQSGRIRLNDPVSKYLPDSVGPLKYEGKDITIQMLSNHSSGLPRMPANFAKYASDPFNPYKLYGTNQLFEFYKQFKPYRQPGTFYEYSNLAVGTLGVILEKIHNKTYEQLITEKICRPLKMTDTRQFIPKTDSQRVAIGYNEQGTYNGPWDFQAFAGAGALRSSASDMLKFAAANIDTGNSALHKAIQATHLVTFTEGNTKTALGWIIIRPGINEVLFHNGGTGGYRSYLAINKEKKFAVIVLSNTNIGVDGIGNELMKLLEK
jgi:CubicO group peptidase (beta-lactamase class C family)